MPLLVAEFQHIHARLRIQTEVEMRHIAVHRLMDELPRQIPYAAWTIDLLPISVYARPFPCLWSAVC